MWLKPFKEKKDRLNIIFFGELKTKHRNSSRLFLFSEVKKKLCFSISSVLSWPTQIWSMKLIVCFV